MSWVALASILVEILSPTRGLVGWVYGVLGLEAPSILVSLRAFRPMLIATGIWQGMGWSAVVYLAAITGINPELYEAATVDGANRFQMAMKITVPSLVPVMTVLLLLRLGYILSAGFDVKGHHIPHPLGSRRFPTSSPRQQEGGGKREGGARGGRLTPCGNVDNCVPG